MTVAQPWSEQSGAVVLPSGATVRGRRIGAAASPADFALLLAPGPAPSWPHRRIRWPDFWVPLDRADALDALRAALRRAHEGERVEVACRGGVGRTGTALAALAILDGLPAAQAVPWVRAGYHLRAVETPGSGAGYAASPDPPHGSRPRRRYAAPCRAKPRRATPSRAGPAVAGTARHWR
ncbi:hypothetical protein GCM10027614_17320 [Micromonospora vulcania]